MKKKKLCLSCQKLGLKSKIHHAMSSQSFTQASEYWDENGDLVSTPATTTFTHYYRCTNGHSWGETK